jgi:hypothetical protein
LFLQSAVFGLKTSQVSLAPRAITLLAALVPGRDNAQHASRRAGRTGPYDNKTFGKEKVGKLMAAISAGGQAFTSRHDILRKQVLETRTKKGGASVKDFAVPR